MVLHLVASAVTSSSVPHILPAAIIEPEAGSHADPIPGYLRSLAPKWEMPAYRLQSPEAYRGDYSRVRSTCTWSEPMALSALTESQLQAVYPWGGNISRFEEIGIAQARQRTLDGVAEKRGEIAGDMCRASWTLPTRVCRHREVDEATGDEVEWTFTRVGPFTMPKANHGEDDDRTYRCANPPDTCDVLLLCAARGPRSRTASPEPRSRARHNE